MAEEFEWLALGSQIAPHLNVFLEKNQAELDLSAAIKGPSRPGHIGVLAHWN